MLTVIVKELVGGGKWKLLEDIEIATHEVGAKVQEFADKYKSGDKDAVIRIIVE